MRSKLKKNYIRRINLLRTFAPGWPLELIIANHHPRCNDEWRLHKQWVNYARTKAGRRDGSYEYYFDKKPSRISHGDKR